MTISQSIRCPNCGAIAQRRYQTDIHATSPTEFVIRTECRSCDHLMTVGGISGRVLRSDGSGVSRLSAHTSSAQRSRTSLQAVHKP